VRSSPGNTGRTPLTGRCESSKWSGTFAEGLRNADIAERLFLSEKTVDHRVSAILRKLDVRTRREAGAEAVRFGLAG
jgi:ATP/maltotriose-dependent transcriptional regulator MalT